MTTITTNPLHHDLAGNPGLTPCDCHPTPGEFVGVVLLDFDESALYAARDEAVPLVFRGQRHAFTKAQVASEITRRHLNAMRRAK